MTVNSFSLFAPQSLKYFELLRFGIDYKYFVLI